MTLNTLTDLAIMIFAGMFCGRMAKHLRLPNVTGYLVAGLLIGPSVLGLLTNDRPRLYRLLHRQRIQAVLFQARRRGADRHRLP